MTEYKSGEESESCRETAYLLGNPTNARRLLASIREAAAGLTIERELVAFRVSAKP
jgi:PHD/YefM family antitoxin component YafN of YafNO toxin-antitoxin module